MPLIHVVAHKVPTPVDVTCARRRRAVHCQQAGPAAVGGDGDGGKHETHFLENLRGRERVTDARAQTVELRDPSEREQAGVYGGCTWFTE